ncbi:MAG: iron-sulfur cluster assembly protein [Sulfurovum sp.]|nr:iron-sulfur cluster assembly protein [Sulfurovum sp.]
MKDPNDIQFDDIPSNAEEMAAWEAKFGSGAGNPVGGVESRFDQTEQKCHKPENAKEDEEMKGKVIEQLKTIYDPELPVDIYNLGLIYDVDCWKNPTSKQSECKITMTLTSATCSMSEVIVDLVRSIPTRMGGDLACIDVELVFDPPWDQSKMSDEAKLAMGML